MRSKPFVQTKRELCLYKLVDRRFYRSKYEAAQVVARFSETLRHEVNLDQLCEQLLAIIQETMQPTHFSL